MNLAHLEYFEAVCRERSITEAARTLHVTQQAVSLAMAALERELGVRLLERGRDGAHPTAAGRELLGNVRELLFSANRLRARAAALRPGIAGSVALAYATCTVRMDGPHPNQADLDTFGDQHPDVSLRTFEAASDACLALVFQGTADLALVAGHPDPALFDGRFLQSKELVLCVPAGHELADRGEISYADLRDVPQLLPPDLNYSLHATEEACRRWGFDPTFLEVPQSVGDQVELVAAGFAVAFMPGDYEVALQNPAVRLVHMRPEEACRIPLWLAWSSERELSDAARAFVDYFVGALSGR